MNQLLKSYKVFTPEEIPTNSLSFRPRMYYQPSYGGFYYTDADIIHAPATVTANRDIVLATNYTISTVVPDSNYEPDKVNFQCSYNYDLSGISATDYFYWTPIKTGESITQCHYDFGTDRNNTLCVTIQASSILFQGDLLKVVIKQMSFKIIP